MQRPGLMERCVCVCFRKVVSLNYMVDIIILAEMFFFSGHTVPYYSFFYYNHYHIWVSELSLQHLPPKIYCTEPI